MMSEEISGRLFARRTHVSTGRGWCNMGQHRIPAGQMYEVEVGVIEGDFTVNSMCPGFLIGDGCGSLVDPDDLDRAMRDAAQEEFPEFPVDPTGVDCWERYEGVSE